MVFFYLLIGYRVISKDCVVIDLKVLLEFYQKGFPIEHIRKFTGWTENKIMSGYSNDKLLILSSDGLGNKIKKYQVKLWFNRVIFNLNLPAQPKVIKIFYYHLYFF